MKSKCRMTVAQARAYVASLGQTDISIETRRKYARARRIITNWLKRGTFNPSVASLRRAGFTGDGKRG